MPCKWIAKGEQMVGYETDARIRKKPMLIFAEGNCHQLYGTFKDQESADEFMKKLCDFMGVKQDETD